MMEGGFMAPSINVKTLDPALRPEEIVMEPTEKELDTVLSNSFGFGGTNATLAMSKYHG
jgi:3-oxoacyl-[acyl-carrier-protein] synthase-1